MTDYVPHIPLRNESLSATRNESVTSTIRNESLSSVYSTDQVPKPYLPLKEGQASRLRDRTRAPAPLIVRKDGGLRGFQPSQASTTSTPSHTPAIVRSALSSQHDDYSPIEGYPSQNIPAQPAMRQFDRAPSLGQPVNRQRERSGTTGGMQNTNQPLKNKIRTSEPVAESGFRKLRSTRSVSDGLRHLRERLSKHNLKDSATVPNTPGTTGRSYISSNVPPSLPDVLDRTDARASVRSAWTSTSSFVDSATTSTERSSTLTKHSSITDATAGRFRLSRSDPNMDDFSVDDAIGMYSAGFGTPPASDINLSESYLAAPVVRPATSPGRPPRSGMTYGGESTGPPFGHASHRRMSATNLTILGPPPAMSNNGALVRSSTQIMSGQRASIHSGRTASLAAPTSAPAPALIPRDRYGFKKASQYVKSEDYNVWEITYDQHLARRKRKWEDLMRSSGLATDNPVRFPPTSDKLKRYVRKGIPPAWRGAAWFWYAGGPGLQQKNQGLYQLIHQKIKTIPPDGPGGLSTTDREHIERDLDRTFPDNIRFKPDPSQIVSTDPGSEHTVPETSIVRALRRLLQAFAVHNPAIGYCQSLNFIAGLLLLFMDEDEEKAFVLMNIITTQFLPGTHGVSLEGANIDIAVLMASLRETLPSIWTKVDDQPARPVRSTGLAPLPTVSLATTAWFMSMFVGTLPMEAVLRVWDVLFLEGSKTLFRVALGIFKSLEEPIRRVSDPMEVFQIVQTHPRSMLDINSLMDTCFRKRNGFVGLTQEVVEKRRADRRTEMKAARPQGGPADAATPAMVGPSKSVRMPGRFRSMTKGSGQP